MKTIFATAAFFFTLAICFETYAFAGTPATSEVCSDRVRELCGEGLIAKCFEDNSKWADVGSECEGPVQTLIENENDAMGQDDEPITAVGMSGIAYGGILRKGPGMDTAKQASLKRGDKIVILEDSRVFMDEYKWFKVKSPKGTGYLWGGIFCIPGNVLPDGVLDNCQLLNQ